MQVNVDREMHHMMLSKKKIKIMNLITAQLTGISRVRKARFGVDGLASYKY